MKYKVGDKVRVRGDLLVEKRYGSNIFISEMEKYKGKVVKVAKVETELCSEYRLGNSRYHWTSEMLRPAEFKIWCETEEEKQAVLEELEKEGYVWKSGREKPTEPTYIGFFGKKPCGLYIQNDELGWDNSKQSFHSNNTVEITPSEFTGIDFSEKIVITKTPTGATATYGDKTVTTEGDFENASRQAFAEVLCPFKVGDKVKVTRNNFIGVVKKVDIYNQVTIKCKSCEMTEFIGELEPYIEPSYNAKLFCVEGHGVFKQGVVYTVENGIFVGVHGSHFRDLEDINTNLASQFMEVKGGLDE